VTLFFLWKKVNFFYENVRAISFKETVSWRMVIGIEIHFANEVKNVREIWCHLLRPQPGVLDGNSLVSWHHQIMFWAAFIFYLVNGQLSTTAVHEVRWVCVLTRGSCFLERFARPYSHRGLFCQVLKTAEITLFQSYIYHLLTVFFLSGM